jgi:predicted nucleotide-binding protein (sugar kinase/HSP70/actin superfamily)
MKRVGIPRALCYYEYAALWRAFLETLGLEIVVSPPTTRAMVTAGLQRMVAETCLPVKVYAGHVCYLRDVGVDYVLIPAIRATEPGLFHCSKFLGLPDLIRAVVEECPPILEMDVDIGKKRRDLQAVIRELGKTLTWKPWQLDAAIQAAWRAHLDYQQQRATLYLPRPPRDDKDTRATIAVVGHPYMLYDSYITHNVLGRLQRLGVRVVTPEMAPADGLNDGITRLTGRKYWVYEGEVTGAAGYYLNQPEVDGVIVMVAFGCGPDSTMLDVAQRAARQQHKPLMSLVLDEHTGVAGLATRLEAFVDMLTRQRRGA